MRVSLVQDAGEHAIGIEMANDHAITMGKHVLVAPNGPTSARRRDNSVKRRN
jgi:broad specificity polyphosphatase/5'/3'-nucleotidase SurE